MTNLISRGCRSASALAVIATVIAVWMFSLMEPCAAADRDLATRSLDALRNEFPGVAEYRIDARTTAVHGAPMTSGSTAVEAAERFLDQHRSVFGVPALELTLERSNRVGQGRFTVFAYQQVIDGTPVEGTPVRVLVSNEDPKRVVYAAARLVAAPDGGFAAPSVTAAAAVDRMRKSESFGALAEWSNAEPVIFQGEGDFELSSPVLTWKFDAHRHDASGAEGYTFFVDASDGSLVHLRDEVYHVDVQGSVRANATPGLDPDIPENPAVEGSLGLATVEIDGGNATLADPDGLFTIPHAGSDPVTVRGKLSGQWSHVINAGGDELLPEVMVTPPGPADLLFNPIPSEYTTSQVNAFKWATASHDFFKSRQPDYTALDIPITTNVNTGGICNAFFFPQNLSINFIRAGTMCPNTAYTTVIAHEYGHFIVHTYNIFQGAFGEGYSDSLAVLMFDDPVAGRKFMNGEDLRNIETANKQYPCEGLIHDCGQVVAGCWWDAKKNFQVTYGDEEGLERVRQLFTDWTGVTLGGAGQDSAHPGTLLEVLVMDDDDGNLNNGSPNYDDICAAFAAHGIVCDPLPPIAFLYPDGRPDPISPDHQTLVRFTVSEVSDAPVSGSAKAFYRIDGGAFAEASVVESAPNEYAATFPRVPCASRLDYYFTAEAVNAGEVSDPLNAPGGAHAALSTRGFTTFFEDDFETDKGWTVDSDLNRGDWYRGVPEGLGFTGDPRLDYDGSGSCFLTGDVGDVVDGTTRLVSPPLRVLGLNPVVRFAYWHYSSTLDDPLLVEFRSSPISPWIRARRYANGGGGWKTDSIVVKDYIPLTNTSRMRFVYSDNPENSIAEAAIDAVRIEDMDCAPAYDFTLSAEAVVRGQSSEVVATGAAPNTRVVFLRSRTGAGFGPCSPYLGGLCIDILDPIRLGEAMADANGVARFRRDVPAGFPLETYALQAVNKLGEPSGAASTKSDVITVDVVEP